MIYKPEKRVIIRSKNVFIPKNNWGNEIKMVLPRIKTSRNGIKMFLSGIITPKMK